MKYKETTKEKLIRNLFRRNSYKLYLVGEFRTSCKNPKQKKKNNLIIVHKLHSCQNCSNI